MTHWELMDFAVRWEARWNEVNDPAFELPPGVGPYDPEIDYVGPQSRPWLSKLISRTIMGGLIDINSDAFMHDIAYAVEHPPEARDAERLAADQFFYWGFLLKIHLIEARWWKKLRGRFEAWGYYRAVRRAGGLFFAKPSRITERVQSED